MITRLLLSAFIVTGTCALGQPLELVRDVNRTVHSVTWSAPTPFGASALAELCETGQSCQLWATDGTSAGTNLIKRLDASTVTRITPAGANVIMFALRGSSQELWVSDFTDAGSVFVRSFINVTGGSVALGGAAYFGADGSLWKSDGTPGGLVLLSDGGYPTAALGGAIFFARSGATSRELWRTVGTPGSMTKVSDLGNARGSVEPSPVVQAGGHIFYIGPGPSQSQTIMASDGTAPGTVTLTTVGPNELATDIGVAGSYAYWVQAVADGSNLWRSDGTVAGTMVIASFPAPLNFPSLSALGSDMYLSAGRSDRSDLWRTDGTIAGTVLVRSWAGASSPTPALTMAVEYQGALYFALGNTLWRTQGTDATTEMISSESLVPWGKATTRLLLRNTLNSVVWTYDGTPLGPAALEVAPGQPSDGFSCARDPVVVGGTAFYAANDGIHGCELWRSDGTTAGTYLVKDLLAGSPGSIRSKLVTLGGQVYFFAASDTPTAGVAQLWRSDGTPAGTVMVKDIPRPTGAGLPSLLLTATDSMLYFSTNILPHAPIQSELWKSDGTEAGTVLLSPGASGQDPHNLFAVGPLLFYVADVSQGRVLMRTDGTAAGTYVLTPPAASDVDVFADPIAAAPHLLYFTYFRLGADSGLWRTDGTPGGTFPIRDGSASLVGTIGDSLVYVAPDASGASALWITDGTVEGTRLVRANVGALPGKGYIGNSLVFPTSTGAVWATDGTATGTRQLDSGYSTPVTITSARGTAFFGVSKAAGGFTFAMSSGFASSTQRLIDPAGPDSIAIPPIASAVELSNGLLLAAPGKDGIGTEPHLLPFDSTPDPVSFASRVDVLENSVVTSDPVLVSGTNVQFPVSASGGEVCVSSSNGCTCDIAPFASSVLANFGQYLCARHFASPLPTTTVTTNLDVGGTSASFSSTTAVANPATIAFESTSQSVNEDGSVTLRVFRYGSAAGSLSVNWSTIDGSAHAGEDFGVPGSALPVTGVITWADGDSAPKEIVIGGLSPLVPLINDGVVEGAETFQIQLQSPSPAAQLVNGTATITIVDEDAVISFAAATASVSELSQITVLTVTRSGRNDNTVRVNWTTSNGTAIAGSDFGLSGSTAQVSGVLTFLPGETSREVTIGGVSPNIRIIDDFEQEIDETFKVTLSSPTNAAVLGIIPEVIVTLVSNENVVAIEGASKDVLESAGTVQLTLNRYGSTASPIQIQYTTVNGTALAGVHYTAVSGTLTWPAGDTAPKTVDVPILDNTTINPTRSFQFKITGACCSIGTPSTTTVNILDDESQVQFTSGAATIKEGVAALTLTATREGAATGAASVTWNVGGGTAIAGTDYSGPTSGRLQWAANDVAPKTITIPIVNDALPEPTKAFVVSLSSPVNTTLGGVASVNVTLEDDDTGFFFSAPTYPASEGSASVTLQVSRAGVATAAASVRWTAANGTAVAGQDYGSRSSSALPSGQLNWLAGESGIKTIVIPLLQDTMSEGNESFTVALSNPSAGMTIGNPGTATITIADDEIPPESQVSFSQDKYVVMENGGNVVLTLHRAPIGGGFTTSATVNYATVPGTALATSDYTSRSGSVTWIGTDATDKTITIPIVNNAVAESHESFTVTLAASSTGVSIGTPQATVTIVDDDDAFPKFGVVPDGWIVPAAATKGWHASNDAGAYEGVFSLRSDAINDNETSQIEVTRDFAAGNVTFRAKVSSEAGFDVLRFFVDGVEKASWSGTTATGWQMASIPITAGSHTVRWSYEKDASASVGFDAAWIDAVTLP